MGRTGNVQGASTGLRIAALGLALMLASCGWSDPGPRIRIHKPADPTGTVPSAQVGETRTFDVAAGGIHTVRPGESLYAISQRYGVALRPLIVLNDLRPPYRLYVGQKIRVPVARTHEVIRGDTLYGISRRYGVSLDALVRLNGIAPPYDIRIGQRLNLPGSVTQQAVVVPTPDGSKEPVSTTPRARLRPDQIPSRNGEEPKREPDPPANARPSDTQIAFTVTESGDPRPKLKPLPPRRARGALPTPPRRGGSKFLWPVKGRVLSTFGTKGKGLHNDGLNIAAPRGAPVRAAENGVVAFSGSELKGFGNMILIKHADGYLTAYAHNEEILVRRGEVIQRGQTIARVGSTGNVDSPQLHFQVRKRSKSVDPMRHLDG